MTNKETPSSIDITALSNVVGGGGGKAYQFSHDSKTDPATCFATADRVGKSFGLSLQGTGNDRQLVDSSGEHAGSAYVERGNCHIYAN